MRSSSIFRIFGLALSLPATAARWAPDVSVSPSKAFGRLDNAHVTRIPPKEKIETLSRSNRNHELAGKVRGGACSDTDPALFVKIGASAILETLALLGVFYAGKEVAENTNIGKLFGLPISQLISILLVVFGSSFFGSFVDGGMSVATQQAIDPNVVPGDPDWYAKIKKPSWNPPGWVFPIMWLIVSKPTQAVALAKVLQAKDGAIPWEILSVYCAHLSFGDMWNKVFFGFQCTGKGAAVITVFFGLLLSSAYLFSGVDAVAGKFMFPTCSWVLVASALNWNIYLNN